MLILRKRLFTTISVFILFFLAAIPCNTWSAEGSTDLEQDVQASEDDDSGNGMALQALAMEFEEEAIKRVVGVYLEAINQRDDQMLLDLYTEDAVIKATREGKKMLMSKDEYAELLPDKMVEWEDKGVQLLSFEIKKMAIRDDKAEVTLMVKAKRGIFTGRLEGYAEFAKRDLEWKIINDQL